MIWGDHDWEDIMGMALLITAAVLFIATLILWIIAIIVGSWTLGGIGGIVALGSLVSMLSGGFGFRGWI